MQDYDWDDLKFFLAVCRAGRFSEAGRKLGADETTVSRRLRRLEARLGSRLFLRNSAGGHELTPAGEKVLVHAEAVERETAAIGDLTGQTGFGLAGTVRISSVPMMINKVLVPNLPALTAAYPGLEIELVPDARNADLSKREADLAVRLARPSSGGLQIKAQKIGLLEFAVYGPAVAGEDGGKGLRWIGYDDAHAGLPQARWISAVAAEARTARHTLRVADVETALEAAAHGQGKTLLPVLVGAADPRVIRLDGPQTPPLPTREVWLLSHKDQDRRAPILAAKDWLSGLSWR